VGTTDIVEAMHAQIAGVAVPFPRRADGRARGIAGLTYRNIRRVAHWVGQGLDRSLATLERDGPGVSWRGREATLAVLNGVLGDHLQDTGSSLAIPMRLRVQGQVLADDAAGGRMLLMIHGLCMNDLQWQRGGHDHGQALGCALGLRPVYLHYNSGRHVSENGRDLAELLERWFAAAAAPVEELVMVGFSLGGLVARSACDHAARVGHRWPQFLSRLVLLGTPNLGAPLERGGNRFERALELSRFSAPLARLGRIRSAGITDLRHGNLLDEDWQGQDRFLPSASQPAQVSLPAGVVCHALAAVSAPGVLSERWIGDGLVPLDSALGRHADPARALPLDEANRWVGYGMGHLDLLNRREVFEALLGFLSRPATAV